MDTKPEINEQSATEKFSILMRFRFAWEGIQACWKSEENFRIHLAALTFVIVLLIATRPHAIWWAVLLLTCGAVLAAELINTAIEKLIDHLHPDQHEAIKVVKDTTAAAVLVLCMTAVAIFATFLAGLMGL